jgi:hypothetical protein
MNDRQLGKQLQADELPLPGTAKFAEEANQIFGTTMPVDVTRTSMDQNSILAAKMIRRGGRKMRLWTIRVPSRYDSRPVASSY